MDAREPVVTGRLGFRTMVDSARPQSPLQDVEEGVTADPDAHGPGIGIDTLEAGSKPHLF